MIWALGAGRGGHWTMCNEELVKAIQEGTDTQDYMLELWEQNKGLIGKIALSYSGYENIEDLKQQGFLGLYNATVNYNQEEGALFSTYATIWIRQSIQRYVEECGGLVRIPCGLNGIMLKYKRLEELTLNKLKRKPTDKEVMDHLGISEERMEQLKAALKAKDVKSLNATIGQEGEQTELYEVIADNVDVEGEILDSIELEELKALLWEMVARLPKDQRHVITEHYRHKRTLKDIGTDTGETVGQTRHKEEMAFSTLRRTKGSSRLRNFLPECFNPLKGAGVARFNATWTSSTERNALILSK